MGLAEPRKRMKLSHDPNNTKWTRDTGGFGHKIMTAQGWQPGEYLGAKDAPQAEFHTAANASHIRVFLKDDNLGLGAKKGSGLAEGECTGLDAFQAILGRLNGKGEDELQKERKSRDDLKRASYSEQRWGLGNFVKGGFLVGDKIQKLIEDEADRIRLIEEGDSSVGSGAAIEETMSRAKKSKRRRTEDHIAEFTEETDKPAQDVEVSKPFKENNSKQKSEKKARSSLEAEELWNEKLAKAKRKRERAERKAERLKDRYMKDPVAVAEAPVERKKKVKKAVAEDSSSYKETTSLKSPSTTPASPPPPPRHFAGNRHAVRSRFIAHKKLAHVDNVALDEIFMRKRL